MHGDELESLDINGFVHIYLCIYLSLSLPLSLHSSIHTYQVD